MVSKKLQNYLDSHHTHYVAISHSPAYTAQEIAARAHVPGHELAKTVILKIDGKLAMAVLPADYIIDLDLVKKSLKAKKVEFADEEEFKYTFPDCEIGAMPPFGNLYDIDTFVAKSLSDDESISFNAGNHKELIRIPYKEYEQLVHPRVIPFTRKMH
ncbi:MAG: YbaK/EbsC family protein [Calditrichaceae bacterium]|nr:YbaK/EbsC family protein [Calditrichaceae bacterium]MBN2708678.1 YbaK/EbsC family protein [Calditrichaceae bacterium]RQV96765.1 MAG: YbaK/EbsC family protein [Calditrichota bacterium]